jgi:WD40 repeat protein
MTLKARDPKYYVVGGPVQPDRDCYQQRYADAELFRRLSEGENCYVLAQRQTGKTSLAASTARRLRARGTLVAMVDLTQASGEDPAENAGRWYYSIAYRIVRELRIRVDIQRWWQERSGLTSLQRLREFFLEIVLEETAQPVAILFDRIEATQGVPLVQDLFGAIRACHDARVTDTVFQRLSFALFGTGSPTEIVKDVQGSPFEIATAIPLPDFSAQDMAGLMAGLGEPLEDAQAILSRVWTWTRGHPYLTQKIFRGLARRKDDELTVESVDELVQTQFLSPNTLREEPHLSALAERLAIDGAGRSARLNLYGRIRKGVDVSYDSNSAAQRELITTGVVSVGEGNVLRVRNEIYSMVFGTRWVNQNLPYGFKGIGIAAAVMAFVVAVPIWYTEYLPRPYVNALSAANQDYTVAEDAFDSLSLLPGYGATADRLFTDFLVRTSRSAQSLPEVMRVQSRMRAIPGGDESADNVLAEFWDRRSASAAHVGNRDAALVSLLEALQLPNESRRSLAAELIGQDYRNLTGSLHTRFTVKAIEADEPSGLLTILDKRNNVDIWRLDGERPRLARSARLIAEERLELEERRTIDELAGTPRLLIKTNHARPRQVDLFVRAPSGQQGRVNLAAGLPLGDGLYAFDFNNFPALQNLAGAELAGNWTIALSDMEQGVGGQLLDWGIVAATVASLATENYVAQPIPEPRSSKNATAKLGPGGRLAMSWPADSQTLGSILIWDLASDEVLARIPRHKEFVNAHFVMGGERIVTADARQLVVWDTATGDELGAIPVSTAAEGNLMLASNGRFLALRTLLADDTNGVVVWDLKTVEPVAEPVPAANAGPVAVDASGKFLAIGGFDPWVRVWSLPDGVLIREFEHGSALRALKFDPSGQWLATDDLSNTFRLWSMAEDGGQVLERLGSSSWQADFSADSTRLLVGASDRAYEVVSLPEARSAGVRLHHAMTAYSRAKRLAVPDPIMLASRNIVVTSDANRTIKVWSIPGAQVALARRAKSLPGGAHAALSADGKRIAVGAQSGEVRIFAVGAPGGVLLGRESTTDAGMQAANSEVVFLQFSGDRSVLASASMDGRVDVWDAESGVARDVRIVHPDGAAHDLEFAGLGRYLVSASRREVIVSDLSDGQIVGRLRIQANHPQLAVAELTGDIYIADDLDGVTVWNWRAGLSERIVESGSRIRKVAVTADGTKLVTASDERELILWDLLTRMPLGKTSQAPGKVDDMWIVADGSRLVIQAGPWLQSLALFPTGLSPMQTRLLSVAPAAAQPGLGGSSVTLLSSSRSRPVVSTQAIDTPEVAPLEGEPAELRLYWRERLGMTLDDSGVPQPVVDYSATL